ncbi:2-dehydropantoate 2-reductase N-terminal domain-containing protein [Paenibacillus sp. BR1-192]|uniref:ketopantoate reductase family protein n=1 Tax=Paenibacillus sp. BR1-192 TaxID=3032287 RepID=UPI00240D5FA9|nr:2-dehydropantoate 2-reductase N-terminal domain-containing protein [Paenibacillus sp. BR1-192]WFB61441.1 2-dehydropantoate 2-reductase N-terminal domain-containing protein [Paenibacillus sp. BR1-192]
MRILVYGAGVLGSYLAHELVRVGHNVTMLARGQRADELEKNGNVIRHYFQFKTTFHNVRVIRELEPDDVYDLIFVVMKYPDFEAVLPALAANHSRHVVIMGNNASPQDMQTYLQAHSPVTKHVAFAFQSIAGWRENGLVISVRGPRTKINIGGLGEDLSWRPFIDQTLANTKYAWTYQNNMNEWLKSHYVMILALNSIASTYNGNLRRAAKDRKLLHLVIHAMDEGHQVLEKNGFTVTPAAQKQFARKNRKLFYILLKMMLSIPISRILLSDKAVSANEVTALQQAFAELKKSANMATPHWDELQQYSLPERQRS